MRAFGWRRELRGVVVLLLLMMEVRFVVLGGFVTVVVMLMAGLGFVVRGESWACNRGHEQSCRKQFLHVKDRITPSIERQSRIAGRGSK